jgi:hypothetical protein
MKSIIRFTFHVSLVSALLIGADILISGEKVVIPGKIVKIYKKSACKAKSKRKILVVEKTIRVNTTCNDGRCNKRVRINRETRTN